MFLTLDRDQPESWLLYQAADALRAGSILVLPTGTGYGFACDMHNRKAAERLYRLKEIDRKKPLAILVGDIQAAAHYTAGIPNGAYRLIKRAIPGPYTFILRASKEIPRMLLTKQKTIGIRIPDEAVLHELHQQFEHPILTTSVPALDEDQVADPHEIAERFRGIDLVIDVGDVAIQPSTVIDLTGRDPEVLREGAGSLDVL